MTQLSQFIRLRSGPPDSAARMNMNLSDDHAALIVSRMREWTKDDVLEVSTDSPDYAREPKNVISDSIENRIAIYLHDDSAIPNWPRRTSTSRCSSAISAPVRVREQRT